MRTYLLSICVSALCVAQLSAAEPNATNTPSGYVIHEEWIFGPGCPAVLPLDTAREAFLAVDLPLSAMRIREAAKRMRTAASHAAENSRASLNGIATELETLAGKVEAKGIDSVQELDRNFANAYQALAQHQYRIGRQSWLNREHKQAGQMLHAATVNLEAAFSAAGRRMTSAAQTTINETRDLSGRMFRGGGFATEEVGRAFTGVGKEIEGFGQAMIPSRSDGVVN